MKAFRRCRTMLTNAARLIFYLSFVQSTLEYAMLMYTVCDNMNMILSPASLAVHCVLYLATHPPQMSSVFCLKTTSHPSLSVSPLDCIFLHSDAFILLLAHFCAAFSAFVPILRHVAAPAQGLKSRLDLYCHEPPLYLVIPLFLI